MLSNLSYESCMVHCKEIPYGILTVKKELIFFQVVNTALIILTVNYTAIVLSLVTYPWYAPHRKIYMEIHGNILFKTQLQF